ncbi:TransThyretin-Related family domain [Caenorhabditis elegans]|uniref:TransThyretin-Related family domain n=1 Tax=Caenorhabditis elegans TaxID=6239 RepID=Q9GZG0_CAEEL|nr:TransThyretin-Related family domain [Caenorhabditis elegans]CCD63293.2 TransThyretin-Related family domain [Caenorhabditis elegans]|eukprot:NP_499954.2 Uncharacterized protein CELE_C18H7.7 [Caenorhabditis elegans]
MLRGITLLFFSIGLSCAWDHFQFDITVFCELNNIQDYNLKIEWVEVDSLNGQDQLSQPKILILGPGRQSFSQDGALNGDEMFSAGYKPRALISHDCTSDRKPVDLQLTVKRLCEIGHLCHYRIITDLTNHWGKEDIEPANFIHDNIDQFSDFP